MDHPPTTTADLMRYAVAAPATVVAAPAAAVSFPPPPPPAAGRGPDPTAADAAGRRGRASHRRRPSSTPPPSQRRVRELEAALTSSEAERERLAQRVAALEAEKKHPKPRGRMPLGATGWDHATGARQYPPGVLPQSPRKRARRASVKARKKWDGESSDEGPPPIAAWGGLHRRRPVLARCTSGRARSCPSTRKEMENARRRLLLRGQGPQADGTKLPRPASTPAPTRSRPGSRRLMKKPTRARARTAASATRKSADAKPRRRLRSRLPNYRRALPRPARERPRQRRARRHRGRAVRRARHRRRGRPASAASRGRTCVAVGAGKLLGRRDGHAQPAVAV